MISPEREAMLARYAAHQLSEEEERELLRAALTDQELFEALGAEHAMREVMDDEESRRIVVSLASEEPKRGWLSALLTRPVAWSLVGVAAAALIAVGVMQMRHPAQPVMEPASIASDATRARVAGLMARAPDTGLKVRFPSGDSFPMHGQIEVRFTSARDAELLVLEVSSLQPSKVLYQGRVAAGQEVGLPAAARQLDGLPGPRELWVVALPPGSKWSDFPDALAARKAQFLVRP